MYRLRSASSLALMGLVLTACGPRIERARTVDDAVATNTAGTAGMTKQTATMQQNGRQQDQPDRKPMEGAKVAVSA